MKHGSAAVGHRILCFALQTNYGIEPRGEVLEGFQEQVVENVRVGISSSVTLDFAMSMATFEETINVSSTPVLDTTSSAVGTNFEAEFIEDMPTTRNFFDMMAVAPGVVQQQYKGATLTFNKRYADGWGLMASYTWSDSTGFSPTPLAQDQGNPAYSSQNGRDPNNWINAEQELQNQRRHALQVQGNFDLPWKLFGTVVYRYLSGKPYNRRWVRKSLGLFLFSQVFDLFFGCAVIPADKTQRPDNTRDSKDPVQEVPYHQSAAFSETVSSPNAFATR